jgi:glutathione synthase/RimK-type ligase-like ATP-grasp enzyme
MIIRSSRELKERYQDLCSGDIFLGILTYKHIKQSILIDLMERGVACFPSPLSQVLNQSKAGQAVALNKWMLPHTYVITRRTDLVEAINTYNKLNIAPVITKEDHMHCGHGVRKWDTIEILYNCLALSESSYPFVLQPFLSNFTDIRVVIAGEYMEAYVRYNPDNFRMNISMGGKNHVYEVNTELLNFCRTAMERGKFPYAHLDIHVTDDGSYYLSEIALNGGTKGAKIRHRELDQKKLDVLERLLTDRRFT